MDWVLFVFRGNGNYFLVPADNKDDAWNQLQKRLSWNMDIVKKQYRLITIMNKMSSITKLG